MTKSEKTKLRRKTRAENNKCVVCGTDWRGSSVTCEKCLVKLREKNKINRRKTVEERRLIEGVCAYCGSEWQGKTIKCEKCLRQDTNHCANKKKIVFEHYGNKCECCGENNTKFLTIDHINNDGKFFRKIKPYHYIIKNNFPSDIRLLCWNCNCGRAKNNGVCPHKQQSFPPFVFV